MKTKKIASIVIVAIGVVLFLISMYITKQVLAGQEQINSGQQKVDTANKMFGMNPVTKQVGKTFVTGSAQERINAGQAEVDYYTQVAMWTKIGGIVLIVVGAGYFFFGCKKKKH